MVDASGSEVTRGGRGGGRAQERPGVRVVRATWLRADRGEAQQGTRQKEGREGRRERKEKGRRMGWRSEGREGRRGRVEGQKGEEAGESRRLWEQSGSYSTKTVYVNK